MKTRCEEMAGRAEKGGGHRAATIRVKDGVKMLRPQGLDRGYAPSERQRAKEAPSAKRQKPIKKLDFALRSILLYVLKKRRLPLKKRRLPPARTRTPDFRLERATLLPLSYRSRLNHAE